MRRIHLILVLFFCVSVAGIALYIVRDQTRQNMSDSGPANARKKDMADISTTHLENMAGDWANAIAVRSYHNDTFVLRVTGTQFPAPQKGGSYRVWLMKDKGTSKIGVGPMLKIPTKNKSDAQYVAAYVAKKDLRDHSQVSITLQENDAEEKEILRGYFP